MRKSLIQVISFILLITSPKQLISHRTDSLCQDGPEELCDAESPLLLPPGCKDYDLVAWGPKSSADPLEQLLKAKIIILGETHGKCEETGHSCVKSLLEMKAQKKNKKINRRKTAILFEEWGQGDKVLCKEQGFDDVSHDCGGWNIAYEKRKEIEQLLWKSLVMQKMFTDFKSHLLPLAMTVSIEQFPSMAYAFMANYIESCKKTVELYERICEKFKEKYEQKNPNLRSKKFTNLEASIFHLKQAEKFFRRSKEDPKALINVVSDMGIEANKYTDEFNQYAEDPEALIRIPNKAMLETINTKATEKNKTMFVFAGLQHINKTSNYNQELYDGLDEHAKENPYVVLSCKL